MTTTISGINGVDNVAPGTIQQEDASTLMLPLGVGQVWQDVTATRTSGSTYTNNTGRPISVCVTFTQGSGGTAFVNVSGVVIGSMQLSNASNFAPISFLVPSGATYSVTFTGPMTVRTWVELI